MAFIPSVQSCSLMCISGIGLLYLERLGNKLMYYVLQWILFYGLKQIHILKAFTVLFQSHFSWKSLLACSSKPCRLLFWRKIIATDFFLKNKLKCYIFIYFWTLRLLAWVLTCYIPFHSLCIMDSEIEFYVKISSYLSYFY